MVVQLRQLERALEQCLEDGQLNPEAEAYIEEYVEAHEGVDGSTSSRIHDMLVRLAGSGEPTSIFLEVLVGFVPCLVNIDEIKFWLRMCFPLATDSGGYSNRLVELSRKFAETLISDDSTDLETFHQIVGWIIPLYIDHEQENMFASRPWTNERSRFLRFNTRHFIILAAIKQPKMTLDLLNRYVRQPNTRLDALEIVSEFVSCGQQAKLFKVYDSEFFGTLLELLEFEKSSTSLSSATTILAMLFPHIYDHVVELLPRLYGCFGRLCSWQPEKENYEAHEVSTGSWEPLRDHDGAAPNIIPFFTYLYGFFPRNTLKFCRQCDLYLSEYYPEYKRPFVDFWSRFMVFQRVENIVSHYLLHPLLLSQAGTREENEEVFGAAGRWKELGSPGNINIFCTNLYATKSDVVSEADYTLRDLLDDHRKNFSTALARSGVPGLLREDTSPESGDTECTAKASLIDGPKIHLGHASRLDSPQSELSPQVSVQSDRLSNQPQNRDFESAAFYARELFLSKNELDFANFLRYTSERKVIRLQKELARQTMAAFKREELEHEAQNLQNRIHSVQEESQKETRSTRAMLRERVAYEGKLLEKNQDLRKKLSEAVESQTRLQEEIKRVQNERDIAVKDMKQLRDECSKAETELYAIRDKYEGNNGKPEAELSVSQADERSESMEKQIEIERLQRELAEARDEITGIRGDKSREIAKMTADMAQLHGVIKFMEQEKQRGQVPAGQRIKESIEKQYIDDNERLTREVGELYSQCRMLDQELRTYRIHEEERVNELRQALLSSHPFALTDKVSQDGTRIRGRGGAQGTIKRQSTK